jgi:dipeptide transport system permease protein
LFTFILRRILQLPFVLLGVSALIFATTQFLSPEIRATAYITSERQVRQLDSIIERYGLDKDIFTQYRIWLGNVLQGNLGWSTAAKRPVAEALGTYLPATLELALFAILPIILFGIFFGMLAGINRNSLLDQALRILSIIGYALPTFVVGIFFLAFFYGRLQLFEPGRVDTLLSITEGLASVDGFLIFQALFQGKWLLLGNLLSHLVLPVMTLTIVVSAALVQIVRSNVIDQLRQDYIRTARAKGLDKPVVTFKHALRNALIPVITVIGNLLFGLVSGVVITETVFNYPGVGLWSAQAALIGDTSGVLGFALFAAFAVAVINLVVDVLYGVIDPRVRYD